MQAGTCNWLFHRYMSCWPTPMGDMTIKRLKLSGGKGLPLQISEDLIQIFVSHESIFFSWFCSLESFEKNCEKTHICFVVDYIISSPLHSLFFAQGFAYQAVKQIFIWGSNWKFLKSVDKIYLHEKSEKKITRWHGAQLKRKKRWLICLDNVELCQHWMSEWIS